MTDWPITLDYSIHDLPTMCTFASLSRNPSISNHSNYIASKLEVWSSRGKAKLEEFLAKMGVGLQQCKQKFPFMSSQIRARLRKQLTKYMEEYGLEDIFYGSFQRFLGFNTPISAADMVYSITALLEQYAEADEYAWLDGCVCICNMKSYCC